MALLLLALGPSQVPWDLMTSFTTSSWPGLRFASPTASCSCVSQGCNLSDGRHMTASTTNAIIVRR